MHCLNVLYCLSVSKKRNVCTICTIRIIRYNIYNVPMIQNNVHVGDHTHRYFE